jgi:putative transposase
MRAFTVAYRRPHTEALEPAIERHGKPRSITVDHGTEFSSRALDDRAYRRGVQLDFIRPGMPAEIGFIKSFNGKLRDECLHTCQFSSIEKARRKIEAWRTDYNLHRPHSALGDVSPSEWLKRFSNEDQEAQKVSF